MLKGQNIVCFANDWDADPTSKHQVMKILARYNRVLWVNSIGLRRPGGNLQDASRMFQKVRKFLKGPVEITPNLRVLTPLVIPFHGVPGVQSLNARVLSRYILAHVRKLGMEPFQMWTFMPTTAPLVRLLKPQKLVYYCVDNWSAFSFLDERLMQVMEDRLVRESDVVIASAESLYADKRALNPNTYLVPHGVDLDHFGRVAVDSVEMAPELRGLKQPIIGFWGLIHEWIDQELILTIAKRHPEWSIALVGRVGVNDEALRAVPNIHLIGPRSYDSLPAFAKGFSAAILPFKINRLTEAVNPIKLREYLAAGLPVVSTPLPEAKPYSQFVRIADTPDQFVTELEKAVTETDEASARQRMEAVKNEGWMARVEWLSNLVESSPGTHAPEHMRGPDSGGAHTAPEPRSLSERDRVSIKDADARAVPATNISGGKLGPLLAAGLLLLVPLGLLYHDILAKLSVQWYDDPDYSHGFLVPLISGYLVWERRQKLTAAPLNPSPWGMAVLTLGLSMLVIGSIGAELYLQRTSLIVIMSGLVLLILGREYLRVLSLPLIFLIFMVPLPAIVVNAVAFPLQLLAAQTATLCLFNLGIPVLREGNVIMLAGTTLEVAEACSGIRSLQALVALGTVYAYFSQHETWKRWALVAVSIPIAILANAFRVTGTGMLAHYWGAEAAEGFYHTFPAWRFSPLPSCCYLCQGPLFHGSARARMLIRVLPLRSFPYNLEKRKLRYETLACYCRNNHVGGDVGSAAVHVSRRTDSWEKAVLLVSVDSGRAVARQGDWHRRGCPACIAGE